MVVMVFGVVCVVDVVVPFLWSRDKLLVSLSLLQSRHFREELSAITRKKGASALTANNYRLTICFLLSTFCDEDC